MNATPGRPAREETTEYYHPYIDLVPDGDIRVILEEQRPEAIAFLESVPQSRADHRYAPGKRTVAEVFAHVNDSERLYTMRAFWFARGMTTPMPSFEADFALEQAKPGARSLASHIAEFAAIRAATLALFRNLPDDAWMRSGIASGFPFSVRALAYIAAGHVVHHTRLLKEQYL